MKQFSGENWTIEDLYDFWKEIDIIGQEFGITYPKTQIEIISSDQMIDVITTIGAPCHYDHWSLGKENIEQRKAYEKGRTGIALELIINSDPTIMYVMENNTLIQQGLVMAHAGVGHGSVFKNNYLFKQWTAPDTILDYFKFAKDYIKKCELEYGNQRVETLIDICRALDVYSITHKKRKTKKDFEKKLSNLAEEYLTANYADDDIYLKYKTKLKNKIKALERGLENRFIELPEENIIYFLEKYSPALENWEREILRIHRKIAEYFYPQRKTKIVHEGWASFIQMRIFEKLYKKGIINEGGFLEFLRNHTSVVFQPEHNSPYYSGQLNPYAIGYYVFDDLYRMTQNPTEEDLQNYPEICNTDWTVSLMEIVKNYSDSDLISRYLTPNVIKKFRLFGIETHMPKNFMLISHTANEYETIRNIFAQSLETFYRVPRLEIINIDEKGRLNIKLYSADGMVPDEESIVNIAYHINYLWAENPAHDLKIKIINEHQETLRL